MEQAAQTIAVQRGRLTRLFRNEPFEQNVTAQAMGGMAEHGRQASRTELGERLAKSATLESR